MPSLDQSVPKGAHWHTLDVTLAEARAECKLQGAALCSPAVTATGVCCRTGCGMDSKLVWLEDGRLEQGCTPAQQEYALDSGHAAQCFRDHEEREHTLVRVLPYQYTRSCTLCEQHGWQGECKPPCTQINVYADSTERKPCHVDVSVPSTPTAEPQVTAQLLKRAARAAHAGGAAALRPEWQGKIVRARAFVSDGFFVRVHMVMTQGIWASLRGLPFFAQLHGDASCADLRNACLGERYSTTTECRRRKTCDAYSDQDGWEDYFEPIHGKPLRRVLRNVSESRIIELSCPAAWYFNQGVLGGHTDVGIYATAWQTAVAFRERNAALVAAWVRVKPSIRAQADAEWRRITRGATAVIGVHLRGTDKFVMPKVPPERYYALIDAYVAQHGGCASSPHPLMYLATDDADYQRTFLQRYGEHCVAQLFDGNIKRANKTHALWADRGVSGSNTGDARSKGLEAVLDALLLSKSDFLLKSASSVSEFAIYWNPRLANDSYDFSLEGQPEPPWLAQKVAIGPADDLAEDPAFRCVEQERDGEAAVHNWQLRRGEILCAAHGWQGACKPPCTVVSLAVEPTAVCNDPLHPPHPAALESITRQLLARADKSRGAVARKSYRWSGKILRIRSFAEDVSSAATTNDCSHIRTYVSDHVASCLCAGLLGARALCAHARPLGVTAWLALLRRRAERVMQRGGRSRTRAKAHEAPAAAARALRRVFNAKR